MKASRLPPYPDSWYCVGKSSALKAGDLITEQLCGQDIIIFRGESGIVSILDPYCSHLGAHLGKGGEVVGDNVRCPFHGFRFNGEGECVETEYGCAAPKNAQIKSWPVKEVNGLIFVYYSTNNESPDYEITEVNQQQHMPLLLKSWVLNTHAQEIVENMVDVGHANALHKYEAVTVVEKVEVNGPIMAVTICVERQKGLLGNSKPFTMHYVITAHGLGCSMVDINLPEFDIHVHGFVLPRPINENQIVLQVGTQIRRGCDVGKFNALLNLVPRFIVDHFMNYSLYRGYIHDMEQDIEVWNDKIYLETPRLTAGDGPIHLFRKFSSQFYKETSDASLQAEPTEKNKIHLKELDVEM